MHICIHWHFEIKFWALLNGFEWIKTWITCSWTNDRWTDKNEQTNPTKWNSHLCSIKKQQPSGLIVLHFKNICTSNDRIAHHEPLKKLLFEVAVVLVAAAAAAVDDTPTMQTVNWILKTGLIKESENNIINFVIIKIMFDCDSRK